MAFTSMFFYAEPLDRPAKSRILPSKTLLKSLGRRTKCTTVLNIGPLSVRCNLSTQTTRQAATIVFVKQTVIKRQTYGRQRKRFAFPFHAAELAPTQLLQCDGRGVT
jgi:hypothetical protein